MTTSTYTLTVFDRWTGETVGTFRQSGTGPDDAFESVALRESLPGVDKGLPTDAFRTELYDQYDYDIAGSEPS